MTPRVRTTGAASGPGHRLAPRCRADGHRFLPAGTRPPEPDARDAAEAAP